MDWLPVDWSQWDWLPVAMYAVLFVAIASLFAAAWALIRY